MISDYAALTVIVSGCALLGMDSPILSGVWLALFAALLVVSAVDQDILADLNTSLREAL